MLQPTFLKPCQWHLQDTSDLFSFKVSLVIVMFLDHICSSEVLDVTKHCSQYLQQPIPVIR